MEKMISTEMEKLAAGLIQRGIPFSFTTYRGGLQIIVKNDREEWLWDAICNDLSYGHEAGLLEIMGDNLVDLNKTCGDTVEGFLTADEILERLDN